VRGLRASPVNSALSDAGSLGNENGSEFCPALQYVIERAVVHDFDGPVLGRSNWVVTAPDLDGVQERVVVLMSGELVEHR